MIFHAITIRHRGIVFSILFMSFPYTTIQIQNLMLLSRACKYEKAFVFSISWDIFHEVSAIKYKNPFLFLLCLFWRFQFSYEKDSCGRTLSLVHFLKIFLKSFVHEIFHVVNFQSTLNYYFLWLDVIRL